jgi:hypothetical protein
MHGANEVLRWLEIAALIGVSLLTAITTAIAFYFRQDVKRAEIKKARLKLGLDVDSQPPSPSAGTTKEVQHV